MLCQAMSFLNDIQSCIVRGGPWTCAMLMQVKHAFVKTIRGSLLQALDCLFVKLSFDLSRDASKPCDPDKQC